MQSNLMNTAMRNGLILGILFSANFLLSVSGMTFLALLTYAVIGLIIYFTYRYTTKYRDNELGGSIRFTHAFVFVLLLYVFATIISSFVKYFFLRFSNSNFLTDMYNQNIQTLEQFLPSITEEMYDAMEILTSPQGYTLMTAWTNIIIAVIIGVIIAAIVKRDTNPFDNK